MIIICNEDRANDIKTAALQDVCNEYNFPIESAEPLFDCARELPREVETLDEAQALYDLAQTIAHDTVRGILSMQYED